MRKKKIAKEKERQRQKRKKDEIQKRRRGKNDRKSEVTTKGGNQLIHEGETLVSLLEKHKKHPSLRFPAVSALNPPKA